MLKRTDQKGGPRKAGRRMPGAALSVFLSVALAVTMMPALGFIGEPAFAKDRTTEELNTFSYEGDALLQHQNTFGFPKGKLLNALEDDAASYPDAFDLRHVPDGDGGEVSYVTPVRVQNPFGTCWGFAAVGAAESSLLSSGLAQKWGYDNKTLDLSEKQIAYFANTYINDPKDSQYGEGTHFKNISKKDEETSAYKYDTGGMTLMATSLIASGVGPVQETMKLTKKERKALGLDAQYKKPFAYQGTNGDRAIWNVATRYDTETGLPDPDSYEKKPVWYDSNDNWTIPDVLRYWSDFKLKDSIVMPDPATYDDHGNYVFQSEAIDAIKQQIYEKHRAVCVSFCAESYLPGQDAEGHKYMSKKWAHYTNVPAYSNHTVTIVGYDDNYPATNFTSSEETGGTAYPQDENGNPLNGAFLIKNSWGAETNQDPDFPNNAYRHWGLLEGMDGVPYDPAATPTSDRSTGYFWISYYDQSMNDPEAFVFEDYSGDGYDYCEQTDFMYPLYLLYNYDEGNGMANVFEAEATSKLTEISAMTTTPGTEVVYQVYLLGDEYQNPEDGILIAGGAETFDYGGYHRIPLAPQEQKVLAKGQKYSVIVWENSPWGDYVPYAAAYNQEYNNMYSVGVINKGESFYYANGKWADMSEKATQIKLTEYYYNDEYDLELDNFPIKSYLESVTYPEGDEDPMFEGYLTVNNWAEGNPGTFNLEIGEKKTLTAEFRGINKNMPASWNPAITWSSCDENIVTVAPQNPDNSRAVIKGVIGGTANIVVDAGDYGVRVISVKVRKPNVTGFEFADPKFKATYTGKEIKPPVKNVTTEDGRTGLKEGVDYTVSYKNNVNAGTATVTVTGMGELTGDVSKNFTIAKAGNTLKVKGKKATVKYSKLKKKSQKLSASKVIKLTDPGQGAKTYAKVKGNKKIKIASDGKVTVKKGLKRGTYKVKANVTAAGDKNYYGATKQVTFKIKVK